MTDVVQQQSRLKDLIAKGKEQGYLTYAEVNDHLPEDISDPDQVEDIIQMINDMGIQVFEVAPDADERLIPPPTISPLRRPQLPWPRWKPRQGAPPTPSACICAKWVPWNC
jgi:hypothetical protein